jgi:hypothetical protein
MPKASVKKTTTIEPVAAPDDLAALIAETSGADLPPSSAKLTMLLQAGSADLLDELEGSVAGDFAVPTPDGYRLVKGAAGLMVIPVFSHIAWPEWGPNRSGLADMHATKPRDAVWFAERDSPSGKAGHHRSSTGNKVEETLYANMLAVGDGEPFPLSFAFRSSGLDAGKSFVTQAERTKSVDGKLVGAVVGKWKITSRKEQKLDFRWYAPVVTRLGVFGEPSGPTVAEMQMAAELRRDLKSAALAEEAARLTASPKPAALAPPRGSITVESGHQPAAIDPNDPIPFAPEWR